MPGERGFGLVGLLVSLAILGLMVGVSLAALGGGGGGLGPSVSLPNSGGSGVSSGAGGAVGLAADEAAQENLRAALDALAQTAAVNGYGGVTAADLQSSLAGVSFVSGPSTGASVISVAADSAADGGVSMAALSESGTCWFTWATATATYFGAEPRDGACSAPTLTQAPAPGTPAPGHVGWQAGSFPAG